MSKRKDEQNEDVIFVPENKPNIPPVSQNVRGIIYILCIYKIDAAIYFIGAQRPPPVVQVPGTHDQISPRPYGDAPRVRSKTLISKIMLEE